MQVGETLVAEIKARGTLRPQDVAALRTAVYGAGPTPAREAVAALLDLDGALAPVDADWRALLVEAVVDLTVEAANPPGYVDQPGADWLAAHWGGPGAAPTPAGVETLLRLLERAREVPPSLVALAMARVRAFVLQPRGGILGSQLDGGSILTADEVALLRRLLAASGGDGRDAISREEADFLFDLNDATAGQPNDPSWSDLFAKGVAGHLMALTPGASASREQALRQEAWLDGPGEGLMTYLGRGLRGLADLRGTLRLLREAEAVPAEPPPAVALSDEAAAWLAARLDRDGRIEDNERALLAFLRDQEGAVHPLLARYYHDPA